MSTPRLLAVDLDGTLLDRTGVPHATDLVALRAAVAQGLAVSIVTGRLYTGTRHVAEAIGLDGPLGCADGSHVVDARSGATMVHHGIRGAHASRLRETLASAGVATFVFTREVIVHDERGVPYCDYVSAWSKELRKTSAVEEHAAWTQEEGVTAVVAVGDEARIAGAAHGIREGLAQAAQVLHFPVGRGDLWAFIARSHGPTKGTALAHVAKHHGVGLQDVVVVGDWWNDVPMFEVAGRSFCMGHGPAEVQAKATDRLPASRETGGGVAQVLAEVFGVKAR